MQVWLPYGEIKGLVHDYVNNTYELKEKEIDLKEICKLYASFQQQIYYVEIDFANKFINVISCLRICNHHPFGETSLLPKARLKLVHYVRPFLHLFIYLPPCSKVVLRTLSKIYGLY